MAGALQILAGLQQLAVLVEPEVARAGTVVAVPDPLRLDEDDDVDDREADREDGPHDADGARVAYVGRVVGATRLGELVDLHRV